MLLNPHHIRLTSGRDVNRYLDRWAGDHLTTPERWNQLLAASRDWADYSARNQILLAAHGAVGPVAGIETWRLVPAADGHTCAVRSGEHGLPVRVPVPTARSEPDPHIGRARPTQAAVEGWEWRSVFCVEQLARRPDPDVLDRPGLPDALLGPDGDEQFLAATRAVAKRTVRGRLTPLDDPVLVLAQAATRNPRSAQRPPLDDALARQVAWLITERCNRAHGPIPEFDPAGHPPRQRWELALDVIDPARRLTARLGQHFGVDLLASPLPRMEFDDDRVVAAGRRNRLPRASVARLPVGEWVEVGPYNAAEWAARGETAVGKGAYLRLNTTAYLLAAENGDRAIWRLEDTRALVGAGVLAEGDAESLEGAEATAIATMRQRYPQLVDTVPVTAPRTERRDQADGWEPLPDRPDDGTRRRQLDHGVTIYVLPVEGEWLAMMQASPTGLLAPVGDPTATRDEAMSAATLSGLRAVREAATESRVDFDASVAALAASPTYTRTALVERVSSRLDGPERSALASNPSPPELVELLGSAGVTSATTIAMLRAEQVDAVEVAPLLPSLGIPTAKAIEVLEARWDLDRTEAAELLGATATDMRDAGCTATEILAAKPREVIETLPADPHLWELAGGTLAVSGHDPSEIAGLLATQAPDPTCFAAGITSAIDDPAFGISLAVRRGMPPEAIAETSERYGLSPVETATALGDAGASPELAVPVLFQRCDGDVGLTAQLARSTLQLRNDAVLDALAADGPLDAADITELRAARPLSRDRDALIAAHIPPRAVLPARDLSNAAMLLDCLPNPTSTPGMADSLLDNVPDADADDIAIGNDLLAAIPEPALPNRAPHLEIAP